MACYCAGIMTLILAAALALSSVTVPPVAGAQASTAEPAASTSVTAPAPAAANQEMRRIRTILRNDKASSCDDATWPNIPADCLTRATPPEGQQ